MIRTTKAPRGDLALASERDAGFSLIEVIVALLVFAIISVGIITAILTIIRMTADNRSREFATNLVAQDMDAVRAIADPANIASGSTTTIDSSTQRVYTLVRVATWQSAASTSVSCGTSTTLYSKRIDDTVTWTGQLPTTAAVRSDTLIAQSGRVSTSSTGGISVAVTGVGGAGTSGVSVSVVPTSGGAAALAKQPAATDASGCSSVSGVTPGNYTVTLSRSGYIDPTQAASVVTQNVIVTAGGTAQVTARYDAAAAYSVSYTPANAVLPTNLNTTFVAYSSGSSPACATSSTASAVSLFPSASGYSAIAGATGAFTASGTCATVSPTTTCLSVQPTQWNATSTLAAGVGGSPAAAGPGGSAAVTARVGAVAVTSAGAGYLTAVSVADPTSGDGNPGCTTATGSSPTTYTFGQVLKAGTTTVGLPFGSWRLYSGASAGATTTQIAATNITPASAASTVVTTSDSKVVVTLDPRVAK